MTGTKAPDTPTKASGTPTRPRRIRRSPEAAEKEILDAAEALLAQRSYRELNVDELMRRTGMTRSTFYHYFRSLDEVAVGLLRRVQAEMMEAAAPWVQTAGETDDPALNIERGILGVAEVFAHHGKVLAAIDEAARHHQSVEEAWREGVLAPWISAVATEVRANHERALTNVEDPEEVARALLLMNMAVFVERLGRKPVDSPAEVAKTLSRIWVGALYPEGLAAL